MLNQANFTCPNCRSELEQLRAATTGARTPDFDSLVICHRCATLSKVGLTGLKILSAKEFNALDEQTKTDLNFATRMILKDRRN